MAILEYPKQNVKYFAIQDVYLKADDTSVQKYCDDRGYTLVGYVKEKQRFSNDGGLAFQYYGILKGAEDTPDIEETWNTEFGFTQIVQKLEYTV